MATLVLSAVGAAVGSAVGGTVLGVSSALIGRAIGASIGGLIDQRLLGSGSKVVETARIDKLRLTNTAEGAPIAEVFGGMRVAAQMIWSSDFKEKITSTDTKTGGKGGGGQTVTTNTYTYSVSIALALCEGTITRIGRIWADGQELDQSGLNLTMYLGTTSQLPDPVISANEGLENTPAFRGTAYVVIEDLQLAAFGNRIPQLNFEVFRAGTVGAAEMVQGACLIPGTGEYSLGKQSYYYAGDLGKNISANEHSTRAGSDYDLAMGDLQADLPNCGSVSLVVSWFGNDLRCADCSLVPKVEQVTLEGAPIPWSVGDVTRPTAQAVSELDGRPVFGGTPADFTIFQTLNDLSKRGIRAVFYPFILMDIQSGNTQHDPWSSASSQAVMPWRGRITLGIAPEQPGSDDKTPSAKTQVDAFFGSAQPSDFSVSGESVTYAGPAEWSYRRFILHYAHLVAAAGGVDTFCIGSEMRSLTQIRDDRASFPAVDQLVQLAADVRGILGPTVKITYAADWSEYFGYHPPDGTGDVFFHLDPLWADPNIDVVGIDNYMPLSDWRDERGHLDEAAGNIYNIEYLRANVAGGEGYDWYYPSATDRAEQIRHPITDGAYNEPWVYRYKDLYNWWKNPHHNRIGGVRASTPTGWTPEAKPFVFTEYGCPAIDKGTNQPNVFIDPKSSESFAPYGSNGNSDPLIQNQYLKAILGYWGDAQNNPVSSVSGLPMVDISRGHLWCWDARPWPDFPLKLNVWSDGGNFARGHWYSGRAHYADLSKVVAEICSRSGFDSFDVSGLRGLVPGFEIRDVESARESLQPLMLAYRFGAVERQGVLVFHMLGDADVTEIDPSLLAEDIEGKPAFNRIRAAGHPISQRTELAFFDLAREYQGGEVTALRNDASGAVALRTEMPLALARAQAQTLVNQWARIQGEPIETLELAFPPSKIDVSAGDVLLWDHEGETQRYRVDQVEEQRGLLIKSTKISVDGVAAQAAEDIPPAETTPIANLPVHARILDLPLLSATDDDHAPYIAATALPWPGGVAIYQSSSDDDYGFNSLIEVPSFFARSETELVSGKAGLWHRAEVIVIPAGAGPLGKTDLAVLNGANAAALTHPSIDAVEIIQFRDVEVLSGGRLALRHLLRGQLGTDAEMPIIWPIGTELTMLRADMQQLKIQPHLVGNEQHFRFGPSSKPYTDQSFTHIVQTISGRAQRPLSPVHLRASKNSDRDLTFGWIRRSRVNADSWQGLDIPLGEAEELYLLRVKQLGEIVREVSLSEPEWEYPRILQDAELIAGPVDIELCQVSLKYGCGATTRITINV